jgi:hypothetical protein
MPKYNYTLLAPLLPAYVDDGKRDLLTAQCSITGVGDFKLTVIGRSSAAEMIRSEMVGSNGEYSKEQGLIESQLIEHMLSVLRLTTDQQIEYLWFGQERILLSNDGDAEGTPHLITRVASLSTANHQTDLNNTRLLFERTAEHRELFKLLSDSTQPTLPLQYRYLSVYKILEIEFKVGKKWPGLPDVLAPYEPEFRSLNISNRSLENYIHEVRDVCAHIRLDNSSDVLGVTGLNNQELSRVEVLFALLKKIIFQHMTTKFPITVNHPPLVAPPLTDRVTAPERKAQLDRLYDQEQAVNLEHQALHWEHEARNRPKVIADALIDCAQQARKAAGLLKIGSGPPLGGHSE